MTAIYSQFKLSCEISCTLRNIKYSLDKHSMNYICFKESYIPHISTMKDFISGGQDPLSVFVLAHSSEMGERGVSILPLHMFMSNY
jgi:hypothetical protein